MSFRGLWAFERGTLWALDFDTPAPVPTGEPPIALMGVAFREALADDAESLARAMGVSELQTVRARLAAGRRCFAAHADGAIAAYGWVSQGTERIGELERTMDMRPGEAYIWDCATLPAYRGRGLYTALLRHIVAVLRDEGARRLWIGASLDNAPSIRGFHAAGFRPAIRLIYLRLLRLRFTWLAGDKTASPALVADARRAMRATRDDSAPAGTLSWQRAGSGIARQPGAEER